MLQRAASNAYSWWWASHIRTKQSKWLEQSLQDMEEKVQYVLKLIEEDGDSFAKRAEMYYKKRPEIIHFVEEAYRAFRALAERYDHLSTELQNANTTIASVFPEQVQFAMDDEEEYTASRNQKNIPSGPAKNAPKVPNVPNRDLKGLLTTASNNLQAKKKYSKTADKSATVVKSGLSKTEAIEEIDKLQKDILALQTVKEFVKSSYESGVAKYWGIENQITEMQQTVSSLQDEFGVATVIEDDEARTLMAEAALKSCQETLAQLEEKQDKYTQEAKAEYKRIEDARLRLKTLKREFLNDQTDEDGSKELEKVKVNPQSLNQETGGDAQEGEGLEVLRDKIKEHCEAGSKGSLTVTELAENIDQLVNKVISLETAVSSQTALIDSLKTETDDLQAQIRNLEGDKATLIDGTQDLSNRLKEMEEKLHGVQDLNQNVENHNTNLQTHFTEARCSLGHLSERLQNVKPDEELEITGSSREEGPSVEVESKEELEKPKDISDNGFENSTTLTTEEREDKNEQNLSASSSNNQEGEDKKNGIESEKQAFPQMVNSPRKIVPWGAEPEKEELNWQQILLSGVEDKEKILLTEYTTILRNYKEVKKKLSEMEKNKQDSLFETTVQQRELKSAIARRDQEIQSLRQKLSLVQENLGENKDLKEDSDVNEAGDLDVIEDIEMKLILLDPNQTVISPTEEKLRLNIDAILDENLDFWLRFSTAFHQVQKFRTEVQDLQAEISQLRTKEVKKQEGKSNMSMFTTDQKSDVRAIYKHLSEIQTQLTVWLEQSVLLKEELKRRFSSLCNIQEEITMALKEGVEEDIIQFSSHQAAKFQGEVLNMKQENNKVREELQAGLDHVSALQLEIEKTLAKLDDEFELSESKKKNEPQLRHSTSRSRIPLRSFIFGLRQKKQRQSIFTSIHHSRKTSDP